MSDIWADFLHIFGYLQQFFLNVHLVSLNPDFKLFGTFDDALSSLNLKFASQFRSHFL